MILVLFCNCCQMSSIDWHLPPAMSRDGKDTNLHVLEWNVWEGSEDQMIPGRGCDITFPGQSKTPCSYFIFVIISCQHWESPGLVQDHQHFSLVFLPSSKPLHIVFPLKIVNKKKQFKLKYPQNIAILEF